MSQEYKEASPLIRSWLGEPFDPFQVEWLPLDVSRGTAIAAPYADSRCYSDRLNLLFGVGGWQDEYNVQIAPGGIYLKWIKNESAEAGSGDSGTRKEVPYAGKVLVVCSLTIFGIGCHRGTGEKDLNDSNALTSADSQSFRRACSKFELGRYFYEFPRERVAYRSRAFAEPPKVPAWAQPHRKCQGGISPECTQVIVPRALSDTHLTSLEVAVKSYRSFGKELCYSCSIHAKKHGMPQE